MKGCPSASLPLPAKQDTSSNLHPTIVKMVRKSDFAGAAGDAAYDGAYLCVRRWARPAAALHASSSAVCVRFRGAWCSAGMWAACLWRVHGSHLSERLRLYQRLLSRLYRSPCLLPHACSYGGTEPLEFALHATLTPCPASYDGAGMPLQCSTRRDAPDEQRRYSGCSATGECECTGVYAKPVPEVFPGECSRAGCSYKPAAWAIHRHITPGRLFA